MSERKRLLIEDWLPAAAIGVECLRERSTGQQPPHARFHVWFARRPLCASRAAVLGSLLPADFPHDVFERLIGFGRPGDELVAIRALMDTGTKIPGGFNCDRAFKSKLREDDLRLMNAAMINLWNAKPKVMDSMAGGGSIPLESARLGIDTLANELNPVACSVLEATVQYPFRFGTELTLKTRKWGKVLEKRIEGRLDPFFPKPEAASVHAYIFARTVPDPNADGNPETPLVPDWHLLNTDGSEIVANPIVDSLTQTWRVEVRSVGTMAGELRKAPPGTYKGGAGYSLFSAPLNAKGELSGQGRPIDSDWIKSAAQSGTMRSVLLAVVYKTASGLQFRPPSPTELNAVDMAAIELAKVRIGWEQRNILPSEYYPEASSDPRPRLYGMPRWVDLFLPRQLLTIGVLVEELQLLRSEIVEQEGLAGLGKRGEFVMVARK